MSSEKSVKLIALPKLLDDRGNLSFVEAFQHVPFDIKRVYWIYDVPGGETRGGHSYQKNQELIIALSGSFSIVVHDGKEESVYTLNRSYSGLLIPAGIWRHLENFSTNSCALILSSMAYEEADYDRDFENFVKK